MISLALKWQREMLKQGVDPAERSEVWHRRVPEGEGGEPEVQDHEARGAQRDYALAIVAIGQRAGGQNENEQRHDIEQPH